MLKRRREIKRIKEREIQEIINLISKININNILFNYSDSITNSNDTLIFLFH